LKGVGTTATFAKSMFAKGFHLVTVTTDTTFIGTGKTLAAVY
jgi:hypothetical protein